MISDTISSFGPQAERNSVHLLGEVSGDVDPVLANPPRLQRVLHNLVSNALRHTPPDGTVTLHVMPEGEAARVEISDTGEGIAAEDLPRLFERSFRGERSRTRSEGEGDPVRELAPRPILLALTLMLVIGAIVFIELRLDAPGAAGARANVDKRPGEASRQMEKQVATGSPNDTGKFDPPKRDAGKGPERTISDAERIAGKEDKYARATELTGSTGLINTDGVSIKSAAGERVVLVEFWTYSCFNCQNAQPHINALYDKYGDDGLLVVGVHSPEFGFERDVSNVREAVEQAGIEYPVVLDNHYAIWSAYDQRFWPAWYLIDADGFIRYRHFGEGAYEETNHKIAELLAERDRISD
jgi:thiol-disulfide isomerase/thioredoxin